jgi:hypothetical protein
MIGVYKRVSEACPGYRPTAFLAMTSDEKDSPRRGRYWIRNGASRRGWGKKET